MFFLVSDKGAQPLPGLQPLTLSNPAVYPIMGFQHKNLEEGTQFNPHRLSEPFEAEGYSQCRGPEARSQL